MVSSEYYLQRDYKRSAIVHVIGVHSIGNVMNAYIINKNNHDEEQI